MASAPPALPRRKGNSPEINVTPLVDVVLVLLIIFMVIAPQLEQGVRVELPGVDHPDPAVKGLLDPLVLAVTADGQLFLDDQPVPDAELDARLTQVHTAQPDRRLVLKGDQLLKYATARDLFLRAQKVGFPGVGLLVGERAKTKREAD